MRLGKRGSIELTAREILVLVLAVIILAAVIGIAAMKLGVIKAALEALSGQGQSIALS